MNGQNRENIKIGLEVDIILKADQKTGKLTHGIVGDILTSSTTHHRGIKVRLEDGQIGRVQKIYPVFPKIDGKEYQEGII
ncbi:MAG: YwbE family protein [Candidatus Nealsonbacteria bacterium]